MSDEYAPIIEEVLGIVAGSVSARERLERVCALLRARRPGYDWVGFYLVDPAAERELFLGPFAGAPTDHLRIPFGRGICGQAADRGETFVIADVGAEDNYLSCAVDVQSEIVVPVFHAGALVGELDIDSHRKARFAPADREFCETVAERVAELVEEVRHPDPKP